MPLKTKNLVFAGFFAAMLPLSVWSAPITGVEVTVRGDALSPAMLKRMEAGIKTVSQHLLVGKDTEEVRARQEDYKQVATELIGRVLYGYTITDISLEPGATGHLSVQVRPYGEVVEHAEIKVEYGNLTPLGQNLIKKDLEGISLQVEQLLIGAPVESMDWLAPVIQNILRERIQFSLPEFVPQVAISGEKRVEVEIFVVPQGEIIRQGTAEITSESLPTALFYDLKRDYDKKLEGIVGLPVSFVARHQEQVLEDIQKDLDKRRASKQFGIVLTPSLELASRTKLYIDAESNRYVVRGEGYLDMGKKDDNVGIKFHVGYRFDDRNEIYLETEFLPENYKWNFYPSYAYRWTKDTTIGYQYHSSDKDHRLWMKQRVAPNWYLRAQRDFRKKENQFSLAYDIHSYVTMEYIFTNDHSWLRIIGHI